MDGRSGNVGNKNLILIKWYNSKMTEIFYFDIHSHLHSDFFNDNKDIVIQKMKKENIATISVGVSFNDSKKAVLLAQKHKNIFATIGIHPNEKENFEEEKFQKLFNENKEKIVGIGECGLDYFWITRELKAGKINFVNFSSEIIRQKKLFKKQINFAIKNNLPMMLHIRSYNKEDAYNDTFDILEEYKKTNLKVNFHFFTEKWKVVDKILKLNNNYTCSFPGVITFANLDESIKNLPIEKIMVETDSPFAAPAPFRGKINTPLYLKEIIKKIAEIKNLKFEEAQKKILENSLIFWNIKRKEF